MLNLTNFLTGDELSATLFIISTPIGNLGDLSDRAKRSLADADLLLVEDTRVTQKLLHYLGIYLSPSKRMVSCHKFNEQSRIDLLKEAFEQGLNVALVSDGGTPLISDPGSRIVSEAVALGFTITPIPGPTALIHALVGSGLPCDKFVFEGFLPDKESHMKKRLTQLASDERTLVFYVPPHGIKKTIACMNEVLGDRRVCLARELTKFFEQFIRSTLSKVTDELNEENLKGEFTVVVAGCDASREEQVSQEVLEQFILDQLEAGVKVKEIAAECAKAYGIRKSDAYALAVSMSKQGGAGS